MPSLRDEATAGSQATRIRHLEAALAAQDRQIDALRKGRFRLAPGKRRAKNPKAWVRVIVPDTHGSRIDKDACAAFLADLDRLQPQEVVLIGDHLDCDGFLSGHGVLGYMSETTYTHEEDILAANEFIDEVQKRCPKAKMWYIEGNHEQRIDRWILTQVQRHGSDARYLRKVHGFDHVLSLERRGITPVYRSRAYDNCRVRGTIRLGSCYFTHGLSHAADAAKIHLRKFASNVVFGHTHRQQEYTGRNVREGVLGAWSIGCLCDLSPMYLHTDISDWSHGYGLQSVTADGMFLHLNCKIADGRSLLTPLFDSLS